ncbi:unnamed protein product [Jaminaea pallidilutea]
MIRPRYSATSSSRSGSYGGSSGGSSDCNTNDTSYSADSASSASASAAATPSTSRNGSFDAAMAGGDDGQKQMTHNTQAATNENDLIQVVYTSSAKDRYMSRKEIEQILVYSRQRNTADSITGLLLYRDGSFAQFLEGPAAAVNATFHRIQGDQRHRGVIVLLNRSVERRDFHGWRMAYRDLDQDLDESNMDEQAGQVGARSEKKRPPPSATAETATDSAAGVDDSDDLKEARSCMIDLQKTGREQLAHSKMSSSIRTLIRVFHSSMGGRQ